VYKRQDKHAEVDSVAAGDQIGIVTKQTPFYAEGGGQVGDQGQIKSSEAVIDIRDTQKLNGDVFIHLGEVRIGNLSVNEAVDLFVHDLSRRSTASNHSATHLLHAALSEVLGDHIQQKGSLVNADRFRFDFSHDSPVSHAEIVALEKKVNAEIRKNSPVLHQTMPIEEAKAAGAAALFGEKYGDEVRVISMGEFSMELCGGTHVNRTGDIGLFKIISESGVAAGIRRLEAITGEAALTLIEQKQEQLAEILSLLKATPENVFTKVNQLQDQVKLLQKENLALQKTIASGGSGNNDIDSQGQDIQGVKLFAIDMKSVDKSILRDTIDGLKSKHENAVVLLVSKVAEKVILVAGVSKSIANEYPAGKLIQYVTGLYGGRGGGRPEMAEGGIPNEADIQSCLSSAADWLKSA